MAMLPDDDERIIEVEAFDRRLAEIEFLQSAYTPDEAYVTSDGCSIIRTLLLSASAATLSGGGCGTVGESDNDVDAAAAVKVELTLEMPPAYPVQDDAILIVKGALISSPTRPSYIRKAALHAIPCLVEACQQTSVEIAESGGGEAIWSVLCCADEWVQGSEWENILAIYRCNVIPTAKALNIRETADGNNKSNDSPRILGRRIIYSHHIIANSKRRDLAILASQYKLGGYVKIGWPGVILIEGSESNCQSFVIEIKRWRWQQLQVRGEEQKVIPSDDDMDSHRCLSMRFEELGENDMSLFASYCREAGLEHLFLTCMKIGSDNLQPTIDRVDGANDGKVEGGGRNDDALNYGVLAHVDHMNDGKRYRNWLRKTCRERGCTLLIRQFSSNTSISLRPTIYVGVFGTQCNVKQVMKQWRISHVDVDSKNRPCLERMMSVVEESSNLRFIPPTNTSLDDEKDINCTLAELEHIVGTVDQGWLHNLRLRHGCTNPNSLI